MPPSRLFSFPVLVSIGVSTLIQLVFLLFYFFNVRNQPFYEPMTTEGLDWMAYATILSYEDTALFLVSSFQLLATCVAFSKSKPFRKPIYSNLPFFLSILTILVINVLLLLFPGNKVT